MIGKIFSITIFLLIFVLSANSQVVDSSVVKKDTTLIMDSTLVIDPNQEAEIAYNKGIENFQQKNYPEAIKMFDEAIN
jgi:hypothetical protein